MWFRESIIDSDLDGLNPGHKWIFARSVFNEFTAC